MKNLICFNILLLFIQNIYSQKNMILIGRQSQRDYNSTSLEYNYYIGKRQKIYIIYNKSDYNKPSIPQNFINSITISGNSSIYDEYFFTTPSATSFNLGFKQKLNKHRFIDFYFAPEFSIVYTSNHYSYKKEKEIIKVSEPFKNGYGWLGLYYDLFDQSGPTYTIKESVKVANVPDAYHYYLNCKTGMSINYKNVILDFNIGLGRKLDSNLKFKPNDAYDLVLGYQPSKVTLFGSMNVGYQF